MDLDALREALEQFEPPTPRAGIYPIFAAARAVLDSEEGMYCPVHSSRWYDGMCERAAASEAYSEAWDMWKECKEPVRRRLLAEEGTPAKRFDPMSDPAFDPDHVTPGGSP